MAQHPPSELCLENAHRDRNLPLLLKYDNALSVGRDLLFPLKAKLGAMHIVHQHWKRQGGPQGNTISCFLYMKKDEQNKIS